MGRRVVITGIGLISPLGLDTRSTWEALLAGRSGVGKITHFDASAMTSRIAAEVKGFDPCDHLERKDARKMDSFSHFAVAAAGEALQDARFEINAANAHRVGGRHATWLWSGWIHPPREETFLVRARQAPLTARPAWREYGQVCDKPRSRF